MIFIMFFLLWFISMCGLIIVYSKKNVSGNPAAFVILLTPIVNTLVLIISIEKSLKSFGFKQLFDELNNK